MCGIIGFFGLENATELVVKGLNLISYRGQDGYGLFDGKDVFYSDKIDFVLNNSDFSLGHCLHAVVDKIKQPFIGNGVFVVNCEIYNWVDLCEKYEVNAKNDAELFFLLLEKFGVERTLELVDGDYAGAYFFDSKLFIFRDLVGVKPLWFGCNNDFLAVSSEAKPLRKLNIVFPQALQPGKFLHLSKTGISEEKIFSVQDMQKIVHKKSSIKNETLNKDRTQLWINIRSYYNFRINRRARFCNQFKTCCLRRNNHNSDSRCTL